MKSADDPLKSRRFDRDIVILCGRRFVTSESCLHDLLEMIAERGLSLSQTAILGLTPRFAPIIETPFRQ